ncbi:MAG: molybdopterin cofactor-binding domain-containing protein, partial [Actinomycetes bacterium]
MTDVPTTASRVSFRVNGREVSVATDHPHLLSALREELNITSPKDGCSPSGQCGCCTIMIDGKAQVSCQYPVLKAEGRDITTLEGLEDQERTKYSDAFSACGGLQCGFCIPGIVMRAKSQVDKKGADLKREDMARHLGAHLCRCTGYVKVLDAIDVVAKGTPVEVSLPGGVGSRGTKYEADSLTLGDRGYVDDIRVPGMLHAALHLTAHVRADINNIDTSAALAAPGVRAVYTAADVPGDIKVGIIYKDWPVFIGVGERTSYAGDVLAVVVADTRRQARDAAQLISVNYTVHRPIVDALTAINDPEIAVAGTENNVLSRSEYVRGDVESQLASSAFVINETFQTQRIEHAFLEPESTLAVPDSKNGTMHVYSGGQGVWDDRDQICAILNLPTDKVTVELVSNGGGFGGKEDMSNQGQTALAAWLLQKPVKCTLSREESLLMHAKRHPIRMEYTVGCDANGKITAVRARMVGDSGSYASVGMKVLER